MGFNRSLFGWQTDTALDLEYTFFFEAPAGPGGGSPQAGGVTPSGHGANAQTDDVSQRPRAAPPSCAIVQPEIEIRGVGQLGVFAD